MLDLQDEARGHLSGATRAFENEISTNPNNAQAWLQLGRTRARLGLHEEALADFKHAIDLEPKNDEAYYFLGCVYNLLREYHKAVEALQSAIAMSKNAAKPNYYYKLGYACQMNGKYHDAIKGYTQYLSTSASPSETYSALLNRGICYYSMSQYEKALKDFDKSVSSSPTGGKSYSLCCRGRGKAKLNNYDGAIEDFNQALKNTSVSAPFEAGVTNNELHKHREAIDDYTRAIEQNTCIVDAYFRRGLSHAALKNYESAIADYTVAIEKQPGNNHPRAHFRRALAHQALKRIKLALDDYTRAITLAEHYQDVYLMRAQLYLQLGRTEDTAEDLKRAVYWEKEQLLDDEASINDKPIEPIEPGSLLALLNSGTDREGEGDDHGAMDMFNQMYDVDREKMKKYLEELSRRREESRTIMACKASGI